MRWGDLEDGPVWRAWRDRKTAEAPSGLGDLVVEMADLAAPIDAEVAAIRALARRCNMAVVAARPHGRPEAEDKAALVALGRRLGVTSLDRNLLADDDGVTPLAVHKGGTRARYIPYTDRPIAWHTDGYYNPPERTVRALLLYCARPAASGGENRLMDHEMLYLRLRDEDPGHIAALMRPDAMTIPGNDEDGFDRQDTVGPVFAEDKDGSLLVRYTARARNVAWSPDPAVQAAAAAIQRILNAGGADVFTGRLTTGMGLVSNNVLHTRERFVDDEANPRLLYRARFHDRILG